MSIKRPITALLLVAAIAAGCAVTATEEDNYSQNRVLKSWIKVNHPGARLFGENGVYVLDMENGTGTAVTDSCYVWAHYTQKTLDQSITSTNDRNLAEQLGQYSVKSYYGSRIWQVDQGYLPVGFEEVLKTMRAGGHASIALPVEAQKHDYSMYNAFSSVSGTDNQIIEFTIDTVVTDIYAWQNRAMRDWFYRHYAVSDTILEHIYLKKLVEHTEATDTVAHGTTINVRYIGRLMDGMVFDTNIEDTAKFYRIYNSDNAYDALSITYYKDDFSQLENDNSVVTGFARAVSRMNYGEKAVTLFRSDLGYGEEGSSPSIPEYSPLVFWLYIEPKNL